MPPQTVVAPTAFKLYPGGVIVLKCAEWLGAGRGTLSTEADARSACGTVVRDSQVVTESIFDRENLNQNNALAEADDTLVVDTSLLPIEAGASYYVFASLLIEGDWDSGNDDTTRGGHQEMFNLACQGRWWRNTMPGTLSGVRQLVFKPRGLDSYRIVGWGTSGDWTGAETITFRTYAQSGTDIEFLLDQIYLVPDVGNVFGDWNTADFEFVTGDHSTSGIGGVGEGFVDGADGGDVNGEFTWHPFHVDDHLGFTGGVGGDYQKSPDDEYCIRVLPDDYFIWNSEALAESSVHGYGIHGPFYIPQQVWTADTFTRTVGDGNFGGALGHFVTQTWGDTPEGFAWRQDDGQGPGVDGTGKAAWVDGSEARMEIRGDGGPRTFACFLRNYGGEDGPNLGADILADNLIMSGEFRATAVGAGADPCSVEFWTENQAVDPNAIGLKFNLVAGTWTLEDTSSNVVAGPITEAWWAVGTATAGWKIEVKRYVIRVRVWDASGAEPSTWDVEMFRPLTVGGVPLDYDYGDDLEYAVTESDRCTVFIRMRSTSLTTDYTSLHFDNIQVEYDPYGDNESSTFEVERPEGSSIGDITLPAGCQHLVYWGRGDWTALDAGDPFLSFSAKGWNDAGAAELQRADSPWWWFRSARGGGVVVMNWTYGVDLQPNLLNAP